MKAAGIVPVSEQLTIEKVETEEGKTFGRVTVFPSLELCIVRECMLSQDPNIELQLGGEALPLPSINSQCVAMNEVENGEAFASLVRASIEVELPLTSIHSSSM